MGGPTQYLWLGINLAIAAGCLALAPEGGD
jgi:hypothetical protein